MSIMQSAVKGVKWSTLSTIITSVLQMVQYTVLAILLVPSDFGLMATVTVIIGFAQTFADMGISNAIIYRQYATKNVLSSLYWTNILASGVLFIVILLISPVVVDFYHEPRLFALMAWAGLIFLITAIGQQFFILLQKNLLFDRMAKVEITSALAGLVAAVAFAYFGFGVFSIVWGQLASILVRNIQLIVTGWNMFRPRLHFDIEDLDGYINFGLYQMGERIVSYFRYNSDVVIIGKFLGPDVLGVYSLAMQLVLAPMVKINPIITRIAFPIFSRYQHDENLLRAGFLKVTEFVSCSVFPVLVGLAVTAPIYVPVIFGNAWNGAIPLIQILAFLGMEVALSNPSGSIYLALGRADFGFKWNVFYLFATVAAFLVAVQYGIIAMAVSYASVALLCSILFTELFRRMINMKWRDYIGVLAKPAGINVLMGVIVYLTYLILNYAGISSFALLAICILAGVTSYGALQYYFNVEFVGQLKMFVTPGKKRRAKPFIHAR